MTFPYAGFLPKHAPGTVSLICLYHRFIHWVHDLVLMYLKLPPPARGGLGTSLLIREPGSLLADWILIQIPASYPGQTQVQGWFDTPPKSFCHFPLYPSVKSFSFLCVSALEEATHTVSSKWTITSLQGKWTIFQLTTIDHSKKDGNLVVMCSTISKSFSV